MNEPDVVSLLENWTVVKLIAAVCVGGGIAAAAWTDSDGKENPVAAVIGICIGVCVFAFFNVIATIVITCGAVFLIVKLSPTIARSINQARTEFAVARHGADDDLRRAVALLMQEREQRQLRLGNGRQQARQNGMPEEILDEAERWEDMQ